MMYVNPFWFGVFITIAVEVVAFVLWAVMVGRNHPREEEEREERRKDP